jgi:uncharacterized protein YprB with RNaseH-like and TPR domain
MSTLEEKLKRISGEMRAYRPQGDGPRAERRSACLHEVSESDVDETSGGLLGCADADALGVLCLGGDFEGWDVSRAAFVDTETTGLAGGAGTVAFLIGLGYVTGGSFVVEQFFMEDYDVEGEMLSGLCRKLAGFGWLVTFNGKCFDAPLIASRAVLNRIAQPLGDMEHIDLLHAARRVYRRRLRQCTLANLEREVLGRARERDIPGALVPEMFFEYLRTGDFEPMRLVLEHNRRDVTSLLTLLCRLCRAVKEPEESGHADDAWSCGRLHERAGRPGEAEAFYRAAGTASGEVLRDLSLLLKRQGRYAEAKELWLGMRASGTQGIFPYVELAKHFEHREADCAAALEIVEECMASLRPRELAPAGAEYMALARRRERLLARLGGGIREV